MILFYPLVGMSQASVWKEDDWQELVDEPSRADLLRMHSQPSLEFEINALPRNFRFPQDTAPSTGPHTFGIDISHYSPSDLPFAEFKAKNIHYVYIKATQGITYKDPKFKDFWQTIGALPDSKAIARGAYHFLSAFASSDPEEQAERFVAYVNLHGGFTADDLPPVMDLEWDVSSSGQDRWADYTSAQIVDKALKFLNRVEALTGRVPMIYTSHSWWKGRIPEAEISKFSRYKLWIADYSTSTLANENPRGPTGIVPDLWQFTDKSRITGGPSADLDGNSFKGTLDDFIRVFYN